MLGESLRIVHQLHRGESSFAVVALLAPSGFAYGRHLALELVLFHREEVGLDGLDAGAEGRVARVAGDGVPPAKEASVKPEESKGSEKSDDSIADKAHLYYYCTLTHRYRSG